MFTVPEIAEIGYKKFEIDTEDTEAFQKQIRKVIEEKIKNGNEIFQPIGKKKSTKKAKNPARAYRQEVKDSIIDEELFDYLREQSKKDTIERFKSRSDYDSEALAMNADFQEFVEKQTFPEEVGRWEGLTEAHDRVKKKEQISFQKHCLLTCLLMKFLIQQKKFHLSYPFLTLCS